MSPGDPTLLDLGSGPRHPDRDQAWTTVDKRDYPGVDRVVDLEEGWPIKSGSVDGLRAHHILEHIRDPVHFLDEAHRVLRLGGILYVRGPYYLHPNAAGDLTHRRGFHPTSLDRFLVPEDRIGDVETPYSSRLWGLLSVRTTETPGLARRLWNLLVGEAEWNHPAEVQFILAKTERGGATP